MVNCRTILCSQGEDDHFLSSRKWSTPIWTNPNFLFIGNNIATRGVANQTKTIKLVWDSDFIFLMKILFLVLFRPPDTEPDGEDGEKDDDGDDARWCRDTDGGTEGGDDGDGDVVGERR